ncbi:hypothetical protein Skr01_22150 [Sphaerisporangium krabiense]|nr:hypothetical protein Skr01_22150 [Sphaerisporangium krabiense]
MAASRECGGAALISVSGESPPRAARDAGRGRRICRAAGAPVFPQDEGLQGGPPLVITGVMAGGAARTFGAARRGEVAGRATGDQAEKRMRGMYGSFGRGNGRGCGNRSGFGH